MEYRCIGVNGFAGDRTPEAMLECHPFAQALSEFLSSPVKLYGSTKEVKDLQWKEALIESTDTSILSLR